MNDLEGDRIVGVVREVRVEVVLDLIKTNLGHLLAERSLICAPIIPNAIALTVESEPFRT